MLQVRFHLLAIRRRTLGGCASRRVLDKSNVKLNVPLSFLPLFLCQTSGCRACIHLDRFKFVIALSPVGIRITEAVVAKIEIGADIAVMTNARGYLTSTRKALLHKQPIDTTPRRAL